MPVTKITAGDGLGSSLGSLFEAIVYSANGTAMTNTELTLDELQTVPGGIYHPCGWGFHVDPMANRLRQNIGGKSGPGGTTFLKQHLIGSADPGGDDI